MCLLILQSFGGEQTSQRRHGMFTVQCRAEEETGALHAQGRPRFTSYFPNWLLGLFRSRPHSPPSFLALGRLIPSVPGCAPCGPQRRSHSTTPTRPAQLTSAVRAPGGEIQATASTQRAMWSLTLMGRYVRSLNTGFSFILPPPLQKRSLLHYKTSLMTNPKDKALCLLVNRQQNKQSKVTSLPMAKLNGRVKVAPGEDLQP